MTSLGLRGWRSPEHLLGEDPKPPKLPWGPEALALNRFSVCHSTCPAGGRWRVNQFDPLTSAAWVGPELLQFSRSVVSDSVTPWTAHSRFPCPDQLPELAPTHVHRVGDAILPSHPVTPFSSCLQSFPASGYFPMSRLFASDGQSIGKYPDGGKD